MPLLLATTILCLLLAGGMLLLLGAYNPGLVVAAFVGRGGDRGRRRLPDRDRAGHATPTLTGPAGRGAVA